MSLFKRGNIYWSRIVRGGRAVVRSTKKKNRTDAMRVEAQWLTDLEGSGGLIPKKQAPIFLYKFFEDRFYPYLENNVTAPRTRTFYRESAKSLLLGGEGYQGMGNLFLQNVTPAVIEDWVQKRAEEVGPSSINGSLKTLRRVMRLAVEWGLLVKAPKIKMLPGEHQREFIISEELLRKMLVHEKCTALLKKLIPFLIDTGLRISECLALTWENVGLDPKHGSKLGWVFVEKGKSRFAKRHIPLTKRSHDILEQVKKEAKHRDNLEEVKKEEKHSFVFPALDGTLMSRHWPSEQFRTLRDEMNLPKDCVVHSTRHTFCTRLGEAGASAFEIQRLAGHSSIVISQRYVHPLPESLERAVSRMEGVAK